MDFLKSLLVSLGAFIAFSICLMVIWNISIPYIISSIPAITFGQSCAINLIGEIVFKQTSVTIFNSKNDR